jgi:hypothetical protein
MASQKTANPAHRVTGGEVQENKLAGQLNPKNNKHPALRQARSIPIQIIWRFWRLAELIAAAGPR